MAYFKKIVTVKMQPNFEGAAESHCQALNNYLKKGQAYDDEAYGKLNEDRRQPITKERVLKDMTTAQTVLNGGIYTTSFLCCDGDDY